MRKEVINIPNGYKTTNIGFLPTGWQEVEIQDIATVTMGQSPDSDSYNTNAEGYYLIQGNADIEGRKSAPRLFTSSPTKLCKVGDLLLSVRAPVGTVAKSIHEACIGRGISSIRTKDQLDKEFLFQYLLSFEKKWTKFEQGSTFTAINGNDIKRLSIPFPEQKERVKIAEILSTWDEAIFSFEKLLVEVSNRKKGLKQQLLTGKVRFREFVTSNSSVKTPVGELSEDWDLKNISSIVQRIKTPFIPEPDKVYQEIGIRSHCKGIFYKEEVTGASLGNKSVFWIKPDCFVVNIVFAWEHAIAKTTEAEVGMIASHRFPMYKPKKGLLDLDYLLYYFKTARGKHLLGLASPGGAGRNKTLGQSEFAKLKIPVPPMAEQKRIVEVLSEADREIGLLQQRIAALKEQKKGLMQKLLTGGIRVKTNNEE